MAAQRKSMHIWKVQLIAVCPETTRMKEGHHHQGDVEERADLVGVRAAR